MSSKATRRVKSACLVLAACGLGLGLGGAQTADGRPSPSGFEVPRWVSLKSSSVHARRGPGLDYEILWEYQASGLPLQVVAETLDWRKVCDPTGGVAWVHRNLTSGRRTVFTTGDTDIALRVRPRSDARTRAIARPRTVLGLDRCEDGWCRVQSGRERGWAPQEALFGVSERPHCQASAPAGRPSPR